MKSWLKLLYLYTFFPIHLYRLLKGYKKYESTGHNDPEAYQSLITTFLLTGGRSSQLLSNIVSAKYPALKRVETASFFNYDDAKIEQCVSTLKEDGFCVLDERLPESVLIAFDNLVQEKTCKTRKMDGARGETQDIIFDGQNIKSVRCDYDQEMLVNSQTVQELLFHPFFYNVASSYLNTQPILDVVSMWWHSPFKKQPDSEAAQLYHFDMDRIKWLKIFIYLTDVSEDNGPHCFIKRTHKIGGIPIRFRSRGYARLKDAEVEKVFNKDNIIEYVAPRGTVIIEDTSGLHKGKQLVRGNRLIFQMQFSNSLFGTNCPKVELKSRGNAIEQLVKSHPRFLSQYIGKTSES